MKKILLTLVCVFGMGIKASALTSSAVLLQHNGNITTYAAKDIAKAMEDAADGDEVFLNEGTYPGFTISKSIKIKGVGQETVIKNNIIIERSDDKIFDDLFIGYVYVENGILKANSEIKKITLSQCSITSSPGSSFHAVAEEVIVDRCDFRINLQYNYQAEITVDGETKTYKTLYVKKFTAMNSKIYVSQGTSLSSYPLYSLINCYVELGGHSYGLNLINSIFAYAGMSTLEDSEFVNTTYKNGIMASCKLTGCYDVNNSGSTVDFNSTEEFLKGNGYLGNDGTVVGPLGGNTPFTLVPTVPHVTEASLKVDPKKQELNATLTVSPN